MAFFIRGAFMLTRTPGVIGSAILLFCFFFLFGNVYGFEVTSSLSAESENGISDEEYHSYWFNGLAEGAEEGDGISATAVRIRYSSQLKAKGGLSSYESTFGYGAGLQTSTKSFAFEGGNGLINQAKLQEKTGVDLLQIGGDSGVEQFAAHSFNAHSSESLSQYGAAAGTVLRGQVIDGYISGSVTTGVGALDFSATAIDVVGRAGGSALVMERSSVLVPELPNMAEMQTFRKEFSINGGSFDFSISIKP